MSVWVSWDEDEMYVARSEYPTPMAAARELASFMDYYDVGAYIREHGFPKRATLPMCPHGEEDHRPDDETGVCPDAVDTDVWCSEGYPVQWPPVRRTPVVTEGLGL